ncbi:MAG: hypothetical protein K0R34_1365 [Herbinix sp.]|nr:hypothetical protein [Herbinix sp.]
MTLKEETKMVLEVLIEGKRDSDEYEIEMDKTVSFCNREEEGDGFIFECRGECEDCRKDKTGRCKYKIDEKFGLVLSNYAEWKFYYINFNQKAKNYTGFYTINNQKQVYSVVTELKKDMFYYEQYCTDMQTKMNELNFYAIKFANKITEELSGVKNPFDDKSLNIIYYPDFKEDDINNETVTGITTGNYAKNCIRIYGLDERDLDDLKQTVRHELIHYILDLLKLNNNDDSAIFWILAEHYDAHPYKELKKEEEQDIYDKYHCMLDFYKNWTEVCVYELTLLKAFFMSIAEPEEECGKFYDYFCCYMEQSLRKLSA